MHNHMKKMLVLCPLAILLMAGENGVVVAEPEQQTIEQHAHEGEWVYPAAETTNSERLLENTIQQRILRPDDSIDTGAKKQTKREKKLNLKNNDNDNDTTSTTSKSSKRGKKRRGKSGKSSKSVKSTASPTENPTVSPTGTPAPFTGSSQFPIYDVNFDDIPTYSPTITSIPTSSPTVTHEPTVSYVPTTETRSPVSSAASASSDGDDVCTRVDQVRCCRRRPPRRLNLNASQYCRRLGCDLLRCPARPRSLMDAHELEYYYDIDGI